MRPYQRRYLIEVLPALALIALWLALSSRAADGWLRIGVALLPLAAIVWTFAAMLRRLLRKDELEQRIELIAIAVASATTGLGSLGWGLLEGVGAVGHGSLLYVLPCLIALYGTVKLWALWRLR